MGLSSETLNPKLHILSPTPSFSSFFEAAIWRVWEFGKVYCKKGLKPGEASDSVPQKLYRQAPCDTSVMALS